MAKITALPVSDLVDGTEFLPVVQKGVTKRMTLAAFRALIVPFLQAYYKGDRGDTGTANSTYLSIAALRAAPAANRSYTLVSGGDRTDYAYVEGDFTGRDDGETVLALDAVPIGQAALVRKGAATLTYLARGPGSVSQGVAAKLDRTTHLMDKVDRASWAAVEAGTFAGDLTGSMIAAMGTGKRVRLPSGAVPINITALPNGLTLEGESAASSVLQPFASNRQILFADSGSEAERIQDIHLADLTLRGTCDVDGFAEQVHALMLNGVENTLIERVRFVGFRGDGLYIGSGTNVGGPTTRHNRRVTVRKCLFDGINRQNRNGISAIDISGLLIEDTVFRRIARSDMPGAIDVEPDAGGPQHLVGDIAVIGCSFEEIGGNVGCIGLLIPAGIAVPTNIRVIGNSFRDYLGELSGADIFIDVTRTMNASDPDMAVQISGNRGARGNAPLRLLSGKGIRVDPSNVFEDYTNTSIVGSNAGKQLRESVFKPTLRRCGTSNERAVLVGNVDGLDIGSEMFQCGKDAPGGYPIQFSSGTASNNVRMRELRISKRPAQTVAINAGGHTFAAANNRFTANDLGGLGNQFDWVNGIDGTAGAVLASGWKNVSADEPLRIIRTEDGFVEIHGSVSGGTTAAGNVILTLPEGFRSRQPQEFFNVFADGLGVVRIDGPNGYVVTHSVANGATIRFGGLRFTTR